MKKGKGQRHLWRAIILPVNRCYCHGSQGNQVSVLTQLLKVFIYPTLIFAYFVLDIAIGPGAIVMKKDKIQGPCPYVYSSILIKTRRANIAVLYRDSLCISYLHKFFESGCQWSVLALSSPHHVFYILDAQWMLFTKAYFIFPVKFRNLTYLSFLLFSTPKAVRNFEFSNSDPGDNLRFNQIPAEEFFFKDLRTIMYSFLRSKCSKVLNTANKCCHCINWRTFAFSP